MTPSETAALLAFAAAFDRRTIGEADVLAWQTVLTDIAFEPAKAAVTAHYSTETRWIMPADIRQAVRANRASTATDFQGPGLPAAVPDADPDDVVAYLAAIREQRTRAADGEQLKPRPVAELIAGVVAGLQAVPDEVAEVRRPGPLGIECPTCHAAPGRPCRTPGGKERAAHPHRSLLASGGTLPDPEEERREMERRRQASARRLAEADDAEADEAS